MGNFGRPFTAKGRINRAERQETSIAEQQQGIGEQLMAQTAPLRNQTVDTLNRILAGERPENFRIFAPERQAVENQFRNARENIIASTPARGGQLSRLLSDAEFARASSLGQLEADIRRQAFNQALGVGFAAAPATSLGAFQNAAQTFGTVANRNETGAMGKNSAFGSVFGSAAAMGMSGGMG